MKIKYLSCLVSSLLLASSLQADSTSLQEALKNGKTNGDVGLIFEKADGMMYGKLDREYVAATAGLRYVSDTFYGFSTSLGARITTALYEGNSLDFDSSSNADVVFHTLNVGYENSFMKAIVGRQLFDFAWANEGFYEGYSAYFNLPGNTAISLARGERLASATNYMAMTDFKQITKDPYGAKIESDGVNILDLKYNGIENLGVNAYYYDLEDIADWYGAKVDYKFDNFGLFGQVSQSSEDIRGTEDGSVYQIEARANFFDTDFKIGYIATDKTGGAGSMNTLESDVGLPMEEGRQIYSPDASTPYVIAIKKIDKFVFKAMYAQTKYGNEKENEFDFYVNYAFTNNFKLFSRIVNIKAENSKDDLTYGKAAFVYSF